MTGRRAGTLVGLVLVTVLGAGCTHGPDPDRSSGGTGSAPATSAAARRSAVVDVCGTFTERALSSDAAADRGPSDARRRAADEFGTPELAAQFGGEGRDHTWPLLVQHQARVVVTTSEVADDPPAAQGDQVGAAVTASRTAIGTDGWKTDLPDVVVYCTVALDQTGGRVAAVTFSDTDTSGSTG